MNRKIKVLIVDDAVVVRKILTDVLATDPDIEVCGTAPNGRLALARIAQLQPDLVTMDIEMPEMDGLEALIELRKTNTSLPVIMFSTLTRRGAVATLEALSKGATDYVTKPANVGSVSEAKERIRNELIPKIKGLCTLVLGVRSEARPALGTTIQQTPRPAAPARLALPPTASRIDVVAIGVSTGGPNALAELIPSLPADFPVPILIVQHMPPLFTRMLAERLSGKGAIPVVEAQAGQTLEPGKAWLAPGDFHLVAQRQGAKIQTALHQGEPENSCRPAVDVLFRSVAEVFGSRTLAIVLTGMGQDGLKGCELIRQAGGQILAQDEATSVVWGMPGFVARAGLAEQVLPLGKIGEEIVFRVRRGRTPTIPAARALAGAST